MAFTRFNNDHSRTRKLLQESTGPGRYMIDVPGNGPNPCFMEDPFIRLQKWGANLQTDTINIESELLGINRRNSRDCIEKKTFSVANSKKVDYPVCEPFTEQPRATNPAWMVRDAEQNNFQYLPLNPQENTCMQFQNNLNTRLVEKDNFKAVAPECLQNGSGHLYMTPFTGTAKPQGLCNRLGTCGTL